MRMVSTKYTEHPVTPRGYEMVSIRRFCLLGCFGSLTNGPTRFLARLQYERVPLVLS